MENYVRKNGLVYSPDMHVLLAVDTENPVFAGRVPFGVHEIDDELFSDCPYTSISLPDSVKKLGNAIFEGSLKLERIKLPALVTKLPPYLFSGCSALTKVTMPNTVEAFPEGLFYGCASIKEIPFRAGIKELPENVFAGCSSLTSIAIPDTVETIGPAAFSGCEALESVVLPANLKEISPDAFSGCDALRFMRISDDNEIFYMENGCLWQKTSDGPVLIVKTASASETPESNPSILKNEVPEEVNEMGLWVNIEDEEDDDTDDIFSSEVGASAEEVAITEEADAPVAAPVETEVTETMPESEEVEAAAEIETTAPSPADDMLAGILEQNSTKGDTPEGVAVSINEIEALSTTMSVMNNGESFNENARGTTDPSVSMEELEKLFAPADTEPDDSALDKNFEKRLRILCQSVEFNKIEEFQPRGKAYTLPDLFVIAEGIAKDENGNPCISAKLQGCCKKLALFHDLKRIVFVYGLDMENEEFLQFFHNFLYSQNVLLACSAPSPSTLSDYAKKICELTGISLEKEDILEQRRKAGIKNPSLIKLIIQDKI